MFLIEKEFGQIWWTWASLKLEIPKHVFGLNFGEEDDK